MAESGLKQLLAKESNGNVPGVQIPHDPPSYKIINIQEYILKSRDERTAHLDLSEPCHERGADSRECRGLLAYFLETSVPKGMGIHCCHACYNSACNNPRHLYWGTASENAKDTVIADPARAEQIRKMLSETKKGPRNPNFFISPWRSSLGKRHREFWKDAAAVHDLVFKDLGEASLTGSYSTITKRFPHIPITVAKTMMKRFKSGWNPRKDEKWLSDFTQ